MKRSVQTIAMLCCAASTACGSVSKSAGPEPGTELYAVATDAVREVLISSPSHKIYAYRWTTDQPFQLMVASRDGASPEQCPGGAGFEQLLRAVATLPVVKESEKHFEDGAAWTGLWLRDTNLDPIEARIRIPEAAGEPVVIQYGNGSVWYVWKRRLFRRLNRDARTSADGSEPVNYP
jgi:hypothetical protein